MYGAKSNSIQESVQAMSIDIHKAKVVEAKAFTTEPKNEGGKTFDVLDIVFKNPAQEEFKIRCFSPENDEDKTRATKSAEYYSKLVVYIASKLKGEEVELPKVKSWAEFTAAAVELLSGQDDVPLWLKLTGNVWNGKANVQVTRYFGWLERVDSGKKPKYSQNEVKGNAEYTAQLTGVASDDADDDAPF
jgi:hypothetical protein